MLAIGNGGSTTGLALSTGAPTGTAIRRDKPFAGALYENGVALDNNYTMATRPTASSSNVGAIITITDAVTIDGVGTIALDFISKAYGASYYWVPTSGFWPIYRNRTLSSAVTGVTVFTQTATFTMPTGADLYPPAIDVYFDMHSFIGTHTGAGTVTQVVRTAAANIVMSQVIATGGTSGAQRTILHVGAAGSQFQLPNSAGTAGFSTSTGSDLTFSLALPGLQWQFGLTPSSATDSAQVRQSDITIWYA